MLIISWLLQVEEFSVHMRLSACVSIPFVLRSWWSLTRIMTRPKQYFQLDSCCCSTFDLLNAAAATLYSNRCSYIYTHIHIFMFWWATRGRECFLLWALSFINIFIELNKLLTFCGIINSLVCIEKKSEFWQKWLASIQAVLLMICSVFIQQVTKCNTAECFSFQFVFNILFLNLSRDVNI